MRQIPLEYSVFVCVCVCGGGGGAHSYKKTCKELTSLVDLQCTSSLMYTFADVSNCIPDVSHVEYVLVIILHVNDKTFLRCTSFTVLSMDAIHN